MIRSQTAKKVLELLLVGAGIAAAQALYYLIYPDNYANLSSSQRFDDWLLSSLALWAVIRAHDPTDPRNIRALIDQISMGTGLVLLLQALLNYFHLLIRSMFLVLVGGLFAALLLALARLSLYAPEEGDTGGAVIIVSNPGSHPGSNLTMQNLARRLGLRVIGTIHPDPASADSSVDPITAVSQGKRVSHILVGPAEPISGPISAALLEYRRRGVVVFSFAELYELLYQRVYGAGLGPAELLLSPALQADSRAMAIQAVYTDLIGLVLLAALSPLIVLAAIAVALFSGKGPVIEGVECAGFHGIPFTRYRFRVLRTDGSGRFTVVGAMLAKLRLDALPQLFNIVRGEMVLFGPRPVRTTFATRMTALMPFYELRFSVKPGLIGWAQAQLSGAPEQHTEIEWLEYDLYYVKQVSFWMDLNILLQWFLGPEPPDSPLPSTSSR